MEKLLLWPNRPECATPDGGPSITCFLHDAPASDGAPRPALLVIPGGGYHHVFAENEGMPTARHFLTLGFNCFVLDYRVWPGGVFPNCVVDAARAVKLIRANAARFGIDPLRVAALGYSAGGHLAACLGTSIVDEVEAVAGDEADQQPQRVNGMVLCYPVTSFAETIGHPESGKGFLGQERLGELANRYNPANRIDDRTPPTFLWHTLTDEMVPAKGSLAMANALAEKGTEFSFHLFPYGDHGMLLAYRTDAAAWPQLAAEFLLAAWRKRSVSPENFHRYYNYADQIALEKEFGLA
ncbi:MAG: alpha/beta hydrolase [Victivallales bacterium]|nr:alpha/beta hydrolase [Victivallales bacterium]